MTAFPDRAFLARDRRVPRMKSEIIERLGQTDVLLPSLIAEGLMANDRVKVRLSVLQAIGHQARTPTADLSDLTDDCRAAGVDLVAMEALVSHSSLVTGEQVIAPGLGNLGRAIYDDVATMLRALKAGDSAEGDAAQARLAAITNSGWSPSDTIALAQIAKLTGISTGDGDSLHRLIMDLHKALNWLVTTHAEEVVSGAHVYGLLPQDRPVIEAFMRGVESTRKLKFAHPGLATTATRTGECITIQNDIGETDAHVIVIAIEHDSVTITYTDIHLARAQFFTGLFRDFHVKWSS
jgi:hypothetical protein